MPLFIKERRKRYLLLILGIFLALVGVEGMSRLYLSYTRRATGVRIHDFFYEDSRGEVRIMPNVSGWHMGYDGYPVMVHINSHGFRGPEIRKDPRQRIIFLGDSIVFNGGVNQEKTFVSLLEGHFQKAGKDVEIINAATTDVGVEQYLLQVESDHIRALAPDLIVVGLFLNDSTPSQRHLTKEITDNTFLKFLTKPFVRSLATASLITDSYIGFQIKRDERLSRRFDWIPRSNTVRWIRDWSELKQMIQEARYDWGDSWEASFDAVVFPALRQMRDLCFNDGITLAVIVFPVTLQVYAEFDDPYIRLPQDKLLEFGKRENIPVLDLLPHLRKHRNESMTPDQGHLNENGNRLAASYMYPFLKEILKNRLEKGINKRRYG